MPTPAQRRRAFARQLRSNATPEERAIWARLAALRPPFTRQLPIGPYVADLACRRARIIVEIDGSQHAGSASDTSRTAALNAEGWVVLRYWNSDIRDNADGVAEAILLAATERLPPGESFEAIPPRAGRPRKPRTRK